MMEEIQTNGPITAGFKVYNDFADFWHYNRNGIYEHKSGDEGGRHAVKIIGWGYDIIKGEKKILVMC